MSDLVQNQPLPTPFEELPRSVRNLQIAEGLYELCYEMKKHQLSLRFPHLTEEELHKETVRLIQEQVE